MIVGKVPKSNRKIVEKDKIDTTNTHITNTQNDCNHNEYSF